MSKFPQGALDKPGKGWYTGLIDAAGTRGTEADAMAKKRVFNITGPCVPSLHYMVDTSPMIDEIVRDFIEPGAYFTINRARQYGKTTTLELLYQRLREQYVVIDLSFEGLGTSVFTDERRFIKTFVRECAQSMESAPLPASALAAWTHMAEDLDFSMLDEKITDLVNALERGVVLMIDEVDKSSNNQLFLDFLGMLRNKYIKRATRATLTFHSVILAGVHDIKNLKMKLRPDEMHSYNSPWNIAARFDVDMSFAAPAIATMLNAYEQDHHTGMDIEKVAGRLFYYTSGYPFLVSLLCKTMDDESLAWTSEGVDEAEKRVLKTNNTLFEDVIKNLVNHPSFGKLVESIVLRGEEVPFEISDPTIDLGVMFGILSSRGKNTCIANAIFETRILNYYISTSRTRGQVGMYVTGSPIRFIKDGKLDMAEVLTRFAAFMRSEYRDEDSAFIEREGRLLFLSFLKPIINGTGHYVVEPETRGSRRMDVVVFVGGEAQIVELKIWHGEQAASEAYDQLTGYLISQEQKEGFLLSFCDNQKQPREGRVFTYNGCKITEVIVAYRDKE